MTGHESILQLRRAGYSPRVVFVNDYPCQTDDGATVSLSKADRPEMLDWRFVVGLTVVAVSDSSERIAAISRAVSGIASRTVASLLAVSGKDAFGGDCFHVASVADSKEFLTCK